MLTSLLTCLLHGMHSSRLRTSLPKDEPETRASNTATSRLNVDSENLNQIFDARRAKRSLHRPVLRCHPFHLTAGQPVFPVWALESRSNASLSDRMLCLHCQ